MDRLTSLTAFVRVVDSGGFSAAGRKLNMSTTMVSNHVQSLEDRLGARLLNRTTRKVSLTEVGQAYYDRCIQILADIEQADEVAGAQQSVPRGTLRIFTNTHLVQFLSSTVTEFLATYPEVKIDLMIGERSADLLDENFDLAVQMIQPRDSALIVRRIATWRHVLCCSHDYVEAHGKPERLDDLATLNCVRHINYPFGDEWHFVDRKGAPAAVKVAGNLVSNSGETLKLAALAGVGVFLAAGFLVRDELESGKLVRLLPEYRPVELTMNAIYPHRHHLSAKVRVFIDLLVHHATEQQKLINPYS
ncbi:LysR family transcriptional regulator [Bradyrhizobium sp. Pear77]|uniref:LysR family transcriptional regulator n=1 Tax=Bradyrhizobium altum TaxID=1571202 RepID=UPI001E5716F9|nr:LysR family transcriptional regulator [Bradyrhizobium altum]MCC8955103.1 LysR family transcriptional regulator [Bradyrhizobium altum]